MVKSLKDGEHKGVFEFLDGRKLDIEVDPEYADVIKHVRYEDEKEKEEEEWLAEYDKKLREKRKAQAAAKLAEEKV
ncbi:unnamed protein product [Acanthoscelides obtectus]|uniref:Uncharacterized protein n=1 Tax=Acanthoscelides obtectus TaxID=200917 RepID=A0A9P0LLD5_ACAOB|nr:unnamed protein product [Acanthoscelides obtectus]CAK1630162.1 hypothetical protein AOBTE_LOCUS6186 [Acanthoscelides obtectus]